MIVFFEKFKRNFIGNKRHTKSNYDIDNMLIEIEIIRRLCQYARCNFCQSKRKRFVNTHAINSEYTDDHK